MVETGEVNYCISSESPLVSVGIPCYNRPDGLKRTLECITNQTYRNLEIIVSDNCSPGPEIEAVVKEFISKDSRIQYYRHGENKGLTFNFQFVLEKATGEYFMWAADDDICEPDFIRTLLTPLNSHLEFSAAMCSTKRINERGQFVDVVRFPQIENMKYNSFQISLFAASHVNLTFFFHGLFRTDVIRKFNKNPDEIFGKDFLIICDMLMSTRIHWVNKVLFTKGIDNTRNTEYLDKNIFCWLKLFFNFAPYLAKSKNIPSLRKFWIPLMMINHMILIGKIYATMILPPKTVLNTATEYSDILYSKR